MPLTPPPSAPPAAPSAPGTAPSRGDPSTFRSLADAFVVWLVGFRTSMASLVTWLGTYITWAGTHVTEMAALQTDVAAKQTSAAASASAASASEAAAAVAVAAAQFADYVALRAYAGTSKTAYVTGYLGAAAPSGIAGLFTRDDVDVTSADNGGTIIVASNGKRWKRVYATEVIPAWFGATGDGVADDTTPLANALATGKRIRLRDGATYKTTANLSTANPLYLSGNATIKFAFVGIGLTCTGTVVQIDGVTFDGNDQCHRGVHGTGQESVLLTGCTVKNIYGDGLGATGFTTGVRFDGPSRVRISKCTFKKIRALGNNVEGDNAGAVRGVYLRDAIAFGLVDDCYFEDVNNVNGIGTIVTEDSDAVHGQAFTAAEAQYLTVQNCHFVNCGKRAAKFQAGSASVSKFTGNTVVSSWMVTQPAALATVNDSRAMYSAVSCYGGSVTVSHNTVTGGVVGNLLDANDSVADIGAILVANNIHTPLYSKFAVRNNTGRTLLIDCNDPRGTGVKPSLVESGNIFAHTFEGAYVNFGKFITMGNISNAETMTADLISFEHMVAIGNITKGVATATTEKGYWLRDGNTFKSAGFIGNVIEGFYDGIYYGVGLSGLTYKASHVGNLFINEGRNDVSEFTAAGDKANYTYTGNNTTKATNSLVSLRGVTAATATIGAAGAPPAQVSAYETVVINATTYKRPLYNP